MSGDERNWTWANLTTSGTPENSLWKSGMLSLTLETSPNSVQKLSERRHKMQVGMKQIELIETDPRVKRTQLVKFCIPKNLSIGKLTVAKSRLKL